MDQFDESCENQIAGLLQVLNVAKYVIENNTLSEIEEVNEA